jgi:hypothetical protein
METFIDELFEGRDYPVLGILSNLVNAVQSVELSDSFIDCFSHYSIRKCRAALSDDTIALPSILLQLLRIFQDLVNISHVSEAEFALKYFRELVNLSGRRVSHVTARYIYQQMMGHDDRFLSTVFELIPLIRELEDDAYFFHCFRQFLGIRLVRMAQISLREEAQLLGEVQSLFSVPQNEMLNAMLIDVGASAESLADFDPGQPFFCRFLVLSVTVWPSYPTYRLPVPLTLQGIRASFEGFYRRSGPRRRLTWIESLETCTFTYQNVSIVASTLQLAVFECILRGGDPDDLGIPEDGLGKTIQSLIRAGLLEKNDERFVAPELRLKQRLLDITSSSVGHPNLQEEASKLEVFRRRIPQIETAITRALKSRGALTTAALFQETQIYYRFPLKKQEFKECVGILIAECIIIRGMDSLYRP